jgi:hypothetical protein
MRTAYLLTTNPQSPRAIFSKKVLENIGFNVIVVNAILHSDKVLSNKISMMHIYNMIQNSHDEWGYVFEDDINIVEPIHISEIIEYEKISQMFFYLGCCMLNNGKSLQNTGYVINNHPVIQVCGGVRGLHGIGISRPGAYQLLEFINTTQNCGNTEAQNKHNNWKFLWRTARGTSAKVSQDKRYMDCILEDFSKIYPANIVRYDLVSPQIEGHRGVLFQDRKQFPSSI